MSARSRYAVALNLLVIAVTVVFVALALVVARAEAEIPPDVGEGDVATRDYIAPRFISVDDTDATDLARASARDNTETVYTIDVLASNSSKNSVRSFFQAIRDAAFIPISELPEPPEPPVELLTPTSPPSTLFSPSNPPTTYRTADDRSR